ncbi:partial 50S ribosomal protein L29, partial [uncultured bacterium]
ANLRFQLATSQLESPIRVRSVRKDIARIQTVLRQREAAAAAGQTTKTENTEVKTS